MRSFDEYSLYKESYKFIDNKYKLYGVVDGSISFVDSDVNIQNLYRQILLYKQNNARNYTCFVVRFFDMSTYRLELIDVINYDWDEALNPEYKTTPEYIKLISSAGLLSDGSKVIEFQSHSSLVTTEEPTQTLTRKISIA